MEVYIEQVYVWADGTYCHEEDLEEFLTFMSDDYVLKYFDDTM